MPNWKKIVLSGSSANLNNLYTENAVTASFFKGDGSAITNVSATVAEVATVSDTFTNASSKEVTHNFDTKNVVVSVYNNSDELILPATIKTTTNNTVDVTFDSSTTGRVVVAKGGHIVSGSANNGFPYTGSAEITGSLVVTGSVDIFGSLKVKSAQIYDDSNFAYFSHVNRSTPSNYSFMSSPQGSTFINASGSGQTVQILERNGSVAAFNLATASFASNHFRVSAYTSSFEGIVTASSFHGDGSGLTGLTANGFPFTGSAEITGSLVVTGSVKLTGQLKVGALSQASNRDVSFDNRFNLLAANNQSANILFGDPDDDGKGSIRYQNSNDSFEFRTDGSSALTISSNQTASFTNLVSASHFKGDGSGLTGLTAIGNGVTTTEFNSTASFNQDIIQYAAGTIVLKAALDFNGANADNKGPSTRVSLYNNDPFAGPTESLRLDGITGGAIFTGEVRVPLLPTSSYSAISKQYLESTRFEQTLTGDTSYTVTHNLNEDYPIVQVYDNDKFQVLPASVKVTNANVVNLTFATYANFEGKVVVKK
jgi:hypothetical protein